MLMFWSAIGGSAIVSGIAVAAFVYLLNRKDKKDETRATAAAERAKTQQEENILIMRDLQGIGHLAEATAIGHKTQHFNGNIDTALDYYHQSRDDLNAYLLRQNAMANH